MQNYKVRHIDLPNPFQLLHADVANLQFLGKSAIDQKYCLSFVDLFTSKVCTYSMEFRRFILNEMRHFYKEVAQKKKQKHV